jgi:uncharacterized membrane protein YhaH (DUF805 family)
MPSSPEQGVNVLSLFSLSGRTTRLGYWRVQLCALVLAPIGLLVSVSLAPVVGRIAAAPLVVIPLAVAAVLATVLRRLHDRGKGAAWWALFVVGPFVVGSLYRRLFDSADRASILVDVAVILATLGLIIWAFIEIGLAPGEKGPNRFGEPAAYQRGARFLSKGWWA